MASQAAAEAPTVDSKHATEDGRSVKSAKDGSAFYLEKEPSLTSGDDEEKIEHVAHEEGLPVVVREIVSLEDRPDDLTITFRYVRGQIINISLLVLNSVLCKKYQVLCPGYSIFGLGSVHYTAIVVPYHLCSIQHSIRTSRNTLAGTLDGSDIARLENWSWEIFV